MWETNYTQGWFDPVLCFKASLYLLIGCDNSDRDKQLKQVFKNAQTVKKT